MNNERIKKIIDKYEIISFDIFDTLIKRNVIDPVDIFKIVQERFNKKHINEMITDFFEKRVGTEKNMRNRAEKEDITFDQIYDNMDGYSNEVKEELKKIEIETELDYCVRNNKMYDIYNFCKEKNKKIICISDMYLSSEILKKILSKNGYDIEDVFVSSEYLLTKKTGNLFKKVIEEKKIDRKKMIHIGDHKYGDFIEPLLVGIKSIKIPKDMNNMNNFKLFEDKTYSLNDGIILSTINNYNSQVKDYYEKFGYEVLGPIIYMFAKWIYNVAKKEQIDLLLFCARDMETTQRAFEILYGNEIKNEYFYISRRSGYLPYLYKNNSFDNFCSLMPRGKAKYTIKQWLDLSNIKVDKLNINIDINEPKTYKELINDKGFEKFYEEELKKYIEIEGKKQFENLCKYIDSFGSSKKMSVVDLGWRGTTQYILKNILNKEVYGMYFGVFDKREEINGYYFSYLFDEDRKEFLKFKSFQSLFEGIWSALHGTTLEYKEGLQPYILAKSFNEDNKVIKEIQDSAILFCKDIKNYDNDILDPKNDIFLNKLIKIGIDPNLKEAKSLGEIYTDNVKVKKIVNAKSVWYYLIHPKKFKRDFLDSEWKIGFLKQIVKIKLPYYKIYLINKK